MTGRGLVVSEGWRRSEKVGKGRIGTKSGEVRKGNEFFIVFGVYGKLHLHFQFVYVVLISMAYFIAKMIGNTNNID